MTAEVTESENIIGDRTSADGKLYFHTETGLRSMVTYKKVDGNFEVYASGDTTYGLIAFWLYRSMKDGEAPNITEFGLPSDA